MLLNTAKEVFYLKISGEYMSKPLMERTILMNKRLLLIASGVGALSAVAISYFVNKQNENNKMSTLENAGVPDQAGNKDLKQLENAKMVSEGSQIGVQYYNHAKSNSGAN